MQKQYIKDFITAGVIFTIILLALALVSGKEFFENAIRFDTASLSLTFFDTTISIDERVTDFIQHMRWFYSQILGESFVGFIEKALLLSADFFADTITFIFKLACIITGSSF